MAKGKKTKMSALPSRGKVAGHCLVHYVGRKRTFWEGGGVSATGPLRGWSCRIPDSGSECLTGKEDLKEKKKKKVRGQWAFLGAVAGQAVTGGVIRKKRRSANRMILHKKKRNQGAGLKANSEK